MSSSRHEREKALFLEAREKPPGLRSAFIAEATGDDPDLRRAVEELLRYDGMGSGPGFDGLTGRNRGTPTVMDVQPPTPDAAASMTDLPPALLWAGVRRLRTVGLLLPAVLIGMWLIPVTLGGRLVQEFQQFPQWAPPAVTIVASLGIVWLTLSSKSPRLILSIGLAYQVVVSYGIAIGQYWDTFVGIPPELLDFDVVGFSAVAVWMLLYSVLVPARPVQALPALLLSAAAPAVAYRLALQYGQAPPLEWSRLFNALVFPHLATVVFAFIAVRLVYRLGWEVGIARELGSYKLGRLLGQGGMGQVWAASHRLLARPAAIKVIRRDALGDDTAAVESVIRRFEQEARTTASLRSAHTVELYDFGTAHDGSLYYVMELLDGIDVDAMVRRFGPLEPSRVVWLMEHACLSLEEAHGCGLVHRDIKPANLFVCRQGVEHDILKVLDFGLVVALRPESGGPASTGLEGTPAFMAPELTEGAEVDARVDLYALGCVMYWALTGSVVFDEPTLPAMLQAHASRTPARPSERNAGVPLCIDEVVMRLLEKQPGARYQTAGELRDALERLPLESRWTQAKAKRWWDDHGPSAARSVFYE